MSLGAHRGSTPYTGTSSTASSPHLPPPLILGSYFQDNSQMHPTIGKGGLERQERSNSMFKLGQFKRAWEPGCGSAVGSPLGSSYFPCCDKMPDESQGKRERFFFSGSQFEGTEAALRGADHMVSTLRNQRGMGTMLNSPFIKMLCRSRIHRTVLPTYRVCPLLSDKSLLKHPYRHRECFHPDAKTSQADHED